MHSAIDSRKEGAGVSRPSPYQLAEKMRATGHKAEIKEYKAASRPAVEVRVPDLQLYVMFMKADVCNKNGPSKR